MQINATEEKDAALAAAAKTLLLTAHITRLHAVGFHKSNMFRTCTNLLPFFAQTGSRLPFFICTACNETSSSTCYTCIYQSWDIQIHNVFKYTEIGDKKHYISW